MLLFKELILLPRGIPHLQLELCSPVSDFLVEKLAAKRDFQLDYLCYKEGNKDGVGEWKKA